MNRHLFLLSTVATGILYLTPANAHQLGYPGASNGPWSVSVSIWSGAGYSPGFSGTINYGSPYPLVAPYAGAYFYSTCGHWHPQHYRAPKNHGYGNAYSHGYHDGYTGNSHGKHGKSHKRNKGHGSHRDHH